MTPFTLVMAYYDNPGMLLKQLAHICALPPAVLQNLHLIVVDDGSPRWPAHAALDREGVTDRWHSLGLASAQLFRMKDDIPWNQDACRNLGVKHASTEWVLMTDMDHVVPLQTWRRLMYGTLERKAVYRFGRVSAPAMEPYKPHPNSWAMRSKTFWYCGGYDEALAGNYGTDGDFATRLRRCAPFIELKEVLIRYPRDVIPDASTTTLARKLPEHKQTVLRLIKERRNVSDWKPRVFSFPFERVL